MEASKTDLPSTEASNVDLLAGVKSMGAGALHLLE